MKRTGMAGPMTCPEPGCPRERPCALHPKKRSPSSRATARPSHRRRRAKLLAGSPACVYCGEPADRADHVVAVASGGERGELVPACDRCNSSKGARPAPSVR